MPNRYVEDAVLGNMDHADRQRAQRERRQQRMIQDRIDRHIHELDNARAQQPAPSTRKEIEMEVHLIADPRGAYREVMDFVSKDPVIAGLVVRTNAGALTTQERAARVALLEAHSPKDLANALLKNGSDFGTWVDSTAEMSRVDFVVDSYLDDPAFQAAATAAMQGRGPVELSQLRPDKPAIARAFVQQFSQQRK